MIATIATRMIPSLARLYAVIAAVVRRASPRYVGCCEWSPVNAANEERRGFRWVGESRTGAPEAPSLRSLR